MNNKIVELDGRIFFLVPILLGFPLSVVQQTHLLYFEPARVTVEVKSIVTDSPCNGVLFRSSRFLVNLTSYAKFHDVSPEMAQLSTTISQAHRATAFHSFTSKHFLSVLLLVQVRVPTSIAASILETHGLSSGHSPFYFS